MFSMVLSASLNLKNVIGALTGSFYSSHARDDCWKLD